MLRICDPFGYGVIEARQRLEATLVTRKHGRLRLIPGVRGEYRGCAFEINSEGLRNREVIVPKPEETFRILMLGNSVPFGWGVAESACFPRLLEQQLSNHRAFGNLRVEVVNAAIPGYGLKEQLQQLEELGPRYAPNLVIVPVMWGDVPNHGEPRTRPRFLTDSVRTSVRTLRLAEILFMAATSGPRVGTDWKPTDLDPLGLEQVCFGLGLFRQMTDRMGAQMVVLDTLGTDVLAPTCDRLGVRRVAVATDLDWLERHQLSPRDPHPDEEGHREIAERVVAALGRF